MQAPLEKHTTIDGEKDTTPIWSSAEGNRVDNHISAWQYEHPKFVDYTEKYGTYCRPRLAEELKAIRLNKAYTKALGDYLFYIDENGFEIKVTDFLGGFGVSIFGHNHPALVKVAKDNLDNHVPFSAQASMRPSAAILCEKLDAMLHARTAKHFITTLASTGTEATEAAIKHAELAHYNRIDALFEELRKTIVTLKEKYLDEALSLSPDFLTSLEKKLGIYPDDDFGKVIWAIRDYNYRIFKQAPSFLSLRRAFHGKTTGSVQLTYNEDYRKQFSRIGINVIFIEPGRTEELDRAIEQATITYYWPEVDSHGTIYLAEKKHINISALFIEPLQGEGGIHCIPPDFIAYCREVCTRHKIHLIFDEIQCGMGRTGTFLYSEQVGVVADYYLLSKGLGGGLSKIAALIVNDELYEPDFCLIHTSTFAEDDHSANIALAALELLDTNPAIMENCRRRGEYLKSGLEKIQVRYPDIIEDVRGAGLMLGVELASQECSGSRSLLMISEQNLLGGLIAGYLLNEHHIRIVPTLSHTSTIRLEPSAFISQENCDHFLGAFEKACEIIHKQNLYELSKFVIGLETPGSNHTIKNYRKEYIPYIKPKNTRKVAFIAHFILPTNLIVFEKSCENFTSDQCSTYLRTLYKQFKPQLNGQFTIKSITGEMVSLGLIGLFIDSRLMGEHLLNNDLHHVRSAIEESVAIAVRNGYQAIGFGGYTSIAAKNCKDIITDSISLTTGNSNTVAMGLEAMYAAAEKTGIDLSQACYAGIGASGNICSIYSQIMADKVPRIILICRPEKEERLRSVAAEIYTDAFTRIVRYHYPLSGAVVSPPVEGLQGVAKAIYETNAVKHLLSIHRDIKDTGTWLLEHINEEMGDRAPVVMTSDLTFLKQANLIVGASNTVEPVIFPEFVAEGPVIINDIAVPDDADPSVRELPNVTLIHGGVVKLPLNPDLEITGQPLPPGHCFACIAETMLMGLADLRGNYSYGKINRAQVQRILDISRLHGFSMGQFMDARSF